MAVHHRDETAGEAITRHRSVSALFWGWVLLAIGCWVALDAAVHAVAGDLITIGVVVIAAGAVFLAMIRPVLVVADEGLTIRNPLRTIVVPWNAITEIAGGMSVEVKAAGRTFTVWAVPVSLRQRGRVRRHALHDAVARDAASRRTVGRSPSPPTAPDRAWADQVIDGLREQLRERGGTAPDGSEGPRVAWLRLPLAVAAVGAAFILAGALT